VTDAILREENEIVTVKWFPNANESPYLVTQGMLGVDREFPAGAQNKINCTIYAEEKSVGFAS
jgi:hypothetical protein